MSPPPRTRALPKAPSKSSPDNFLIFGTLTLGLISSHVKHYCSPSPSALLLLSQIAPTASPPRGITTRFLHFLLAKPLVLSAEQHAVVLTPSLVKQPAFVPVLLRPSDMTLAPASQDLAVTMLCYHKETTTLLPNTNKYNKGVTGP